MKRDEFEARLLDLWMTSAIPLTYASVQYHTGAPRRKVRGWLDDMVREGVLDVDSSDEGDLLFEVPGAARAADGPRTFDEFQRLQRLRASVAAEGERDRAGQERERAELRARRERARALQQAAARAEADPIGDAMAQARDLKALKSLNKRDGARGAARALARSARQDLAQNTAGGRKSLVLSGGLSLILGPLGWLYAGSFREAIPATFAYVLLCLILPTFLLAPLLGIALPVSAVAGVVYAWQHNHDGQRGTLLLGDGNEDK